MSFHEKFVQYDLGEGHPFRGDRFVNSMRLFESQGLFKLGKIALNKPRSASIEELLKVHSEDYIDLIFRLAKECKGYDFDTPVSPEILEAALLIVGGAIECGEVVLNGRASRAISIGGGFHHAGRNYGGGFCIFNDIAILVEHLRANYGVKRFLILDYDVHFGNGTSDIYYRDPSVLYISLHQDPRTVYPGTGFVWQVGEGDGEGFNVNVPLPPGTDDSTYLYALSEIFVPLAEEFKPEIVIANGGSDSHFADMLGDLRLTAKGFFNVASLIREVADKVCSKRLVLIPGSGYNPKVLPLCWYALVAGAIGLKDIDIEGPYPLPNRSPQCQGTVERTLDELKRLLRKYWVCFGVSY
jgi:acetoin utilization protein AcuC